ncbi:MAG: hypothetical protein AAF557_20015 [Pseudomonadota bacterium]
MGTENPGAFGTTRIFAGVKASGAWVPFDQLISGGGSFTSDVDGEEHVWGAGVTVGAEMDFTEDIYAQTKLTVGGASRGATVRSSGSVLYDGSEVVPYFGIGFGLFYDFCGCAEIGATASYSYLGEIDVESSFGNSIELGSASAFTFGLSLKRAF